MCCGERTDVLHVFVYAPLAWRREYAKTNPIVRPPPKRASGTRSTRPTASAPPYYNYYTQNRWGDVHNYDLSLNAALGKEAASR